MTTIDSEALQTKLDNGEGVCVVDIRPEEDYEANHIEGSENKPIREALLSGDREAALAELDELPDDEELVMVCDSGLPQQRRPVNSNLGERTRVPLTVG